MKPISELNISPWPWKNHGVEHTKFGLVRVRDKNGSFVADIEGEYNNKAYANGDVIAAAPELYGELWKVCFGHSKTINCRKCEGDKLGNCSECTLGGARAALAKAAGEWGEQ